MDPVRKAVLWLSIPLNILLIVWVWLGRGLFGVEWGWTFIIMMVTALPALVILLGLTTVLEYRQPARPIRLTAAQAAAQIVIWLAMVAFGFAIVDFDDSGRTESVLSRWFGEGALGVSEIVAKISTGAGVVAWLALLVLLLAGWRRTPTRTT
jgi:hypothetical protein